MKNLNKQNNTDYIIQFKDNYRFISSENDKDLSDLIISQVDCGILAINTEFNIQSNFSFLNLFCCPSRKEFDKFVQLFTKIPTTESRVAQPHGHDLYILSPKCYKNDAKCYALKQPPFYDVEDFKRTIIHETVHIWEELNSPEGAMETRPDWWAQGLAVCLSKQYEEKDFKKRLNDDFKKGFVPKSEEMIGWRAYVWGCVLIQFLLENYDKNVLLNVLLKTVDEDIISFFEPNKNLFFNNFENYVRKIRKNDLG